jgi:site-specific DNA-cytosine methylase
VSDFTVVDVNGLNGALALGAVNAGGRLLYRTGYLNLGQKLIARNASMWGPDWEDLIDVKGKGTPASWPLPEKADVVVAVPPCSGFSVMTGKGGPGAGTGSAQQRSASHPSNDCMWDSARYVARHAPEVYLFESVTGAFKIGRELMLALRDEIERISGEKYTLTHWLHDGCVMGAPTSRQRYMFVITRDDPVAGSRPFEVTPADEYAVENFTTVWDAIGDLENLITPQMEDQPVPTPGAGGDWAHARQRADGLVDGAAYYSGPTWSARIYKTFEVATRLGVPWANGSGQGQALGMIYQVGGRDALIEVGGPDFADRMIKVGFSLGPYSSRRECPDAMHNLIAGGGTGGHIHPTRDRFMTYRELARIQGWPDELRIDIDKKIYGKENIEAVWGKAVGCLVANHAGSEVAEFLANDPHGGTKTSGELIGDREWLIDELEHSRRLRRESARVKRGHIVEAGYA